MLPSRWPKESRQLRHSHKDNAEGPAVEEETVPTVPSPRVPCGLDKDVTGAQADCTSPH